VAARALGEDLQDQQGAVVDRQAHVPFQVALLRRAEGLVEEDLAGAGFLGELLDLVGLALAHEERGIGCLALRRDAGDRFHARGLGQLAQFLELGVEMGKAQVHPHQDGGGGRAVG